MKIEVNINKKYALAPGDTPDPGHNINSVGPPTLCTAGQVLSWDGTNWKCLDIRTVGPTGIISGVNLANINARSNNCGIYFDEVQLSAKPFVGGSNWKNCLTYNEIFTNSMIFFQNYFGGTCTVLDKDQSGSISEGDFTELSITLAYFGVDCN